MRGEETDAVCVCERERAREREREETMPVGSHLASAAGRVTVKMRTFASTVLLLFLPLLSEAADSGDGSTCHMVFKFKNEVREGSEHQLIGGVFKVQSTRLCNYTSSK